MATKGKRSIFQDACTIKAIEGVADAAIRPGALVVQTATGLEESDVAATVFGAQHLFADYNFLQAGTVDDSWEADETAVARVLETNRIANVLVAAGQDITSEGVALSSNGDGTLKIAATEGTEEVLAHSNEIINTGAAVTLVRVRGA